MMSSDGSITSSSASRIRQFGLYRTIDARTEEFLRLSRRRQIRQGCACAAVSTAITVTVVVVILLIYEYAIAGEWSLVQRNSEGNSTEEINTDDHPIAERLDRSYFGFDQDYYERMPLLVNALQESTYIDPTIEIIPASKKDRNIKIIRNPITTQATSTYFRHHKSDNIRRTSPKPFALEYRSSTPLPLSKIYGSKNWVEKYRNAQRLQNIRQVIKYLEKTINAKSADMYTRAPTKQIAFTGVYVEPMVNHSKESDSKIELDLLLQDSTKDETFHSNHHIDPLFNYKPDNPGEVNLLADGFLRFSPIPTNNKPMFRRVANYKRFCLGNRCNKTKISDNIWHSLNVSQSTNNPSATTTKSFSVMLNLFPLNPTSKSETDYRRKDTLNNPKSSPTAVYFTTKRPMIQFKRRITPIKRTFVRKRPRIFGENIQKVHESDISDFNKNEHVSKDTEAKMIVHVNMYSTDMKTEANDKITATESHSIINQPMQPTSPYVTEAPIELSTSQIEDYHSGSSGIIPVTLMSTIPSLPKVTSVLPFFSPTDNFEENSWSTKPPDILKFSHADAKVPDQFIELYKIDSELTTDINIRNSGNVNKYNTVKINIAKPKNNIATTENTSKPTPEGVRKEFADTTTVGTYVPQMNGHYRSIHPRWSDSLESSRKRRLEMSINSLRNPTYVPMYVEIRRNNTIKSNDNE